MDGSGRNVELSLREEREQEKQAFYKSLEEYWDKINKVRDELEKIASALIGTNPGIDESLGKAVDDIDEAMGYINSILSEDEYEPDWDEMARKEYWGC